MVAPIRVGVLLVEWIRDFTGGPGVCRAEFIRPREIGRAVGLVE